MKKPTIIVLIALAAFTLLLLAFCGKKKEQPQPPPVVVKPQPTPPVVEPAVEPPIAVAPAETGRGPQKKVTPKPRKLTADGDLVLDADRLVHDPRGGSWSIRVPEGVAVRLERFVPMFTTTDFGPTDLCQHTDFRVLPCHIMFYNANTADYRTYAQRLVFRKEQISGVRRRRITADANSLVYSPDGLWNMKLPVSVKIVEETYTPKYDLTNYVPKDDWPVGTVPCGYSLPTGFDNAIAYTEVGPKPALPCNMLFPSVGKRWIASKVTGGRQGTK